MITIGMCDDNQQWLKLFSDYIRTMFSNDTSMPEVDIETYNNKNQLLEALKTKEYNYVFLDLELEDGHNEGGFEIAEVIKELDTTKLVFVSSHSEHIVKSFRFYTFAFVRKERWKEDVVILFDKMKEIYQKECGIYTIKIKGTMVELDTNKVYKVIMHKHNMLFYGNNIITVRGKFSEYEKELYKYGFITIGRGCMVNKKSIVDYANSELTINNGERIKVSRSRHNDVKKIVIELKNR